MSSPEAVAGKAGGATPEPLVIQHAPMSERQQLALIKRLEKDAQNQSNSDPSVLISPPRAPLQVVTDANGANVGGGGHGNAGVPAGGAGAATSSTSSSAAESPSSNGTTPSTTSLRRTIFSQHQNNGHSPTVDRLLKKISKKNTKGETPLHTAAIRGSTRLVHQLLQIGADPNVQDNAEWSPLHEACNRGNFSVVKVLHKFGADLNLKGFGKDSPLHDAARNGHLKVVKFLIKSGANIFAKNSNNRTPREEAEVTLLRISENEDLAKTVSYLVDYEEVEAQNEHFNKTQCIGVSSLLETAATISDISSDSESDAEVENNDLAKFLGLSKSPVVSQALEILGFTPTTPTSLNGNNGSGIRNRQNNKKAMASGTDNSKATPTSARSKGQANVLSPASKNTYTHCATTKIRRLTYDEVGDTTTKKKATENLECSSIKRIKMSPAASETSALEASATSTTTEEIEMKKVPPLKIVLPKTKVSGAGGGIGRSGSKEENEVNLKPKNLQVSSSSSEVNDVTSDIRGCFQNGGKIQISISSPDKQQQQQSPLLLPPQQPFASSTLSSSASSLEPFEYYMKKRKLRNPAVAVVLPQKRGHEEHDQQQQQQRHHQPLKVVKDEEPHQRRIPVEYDDDHQQQQQSSMANLQNPLENDSSGEEYPPMNLLQNEEPMSSEPLRESWVPPPALTASPQKLVSDGNGRGGRAGYASVASRNRPPPTQPPVANIRQNIMRHEFENGNRLARVRKRHEHLMKKLPNADPAFLLLKAVEFEGKSIEEINNWINENNIKICPVCQESTNGTTIWYCNMCSNAFHSGCLGIIGKHLICPICLVAHCTCFKNNPDGTRRHEPDVGPVYTHLGSAGNLKTLRDNMEKNYLGYSGGNDALRIVETKYCPKNDKSESECPRASALPPGHKFERTSEKEKFLVLVKERTGHYCNHTWMVVLVVNWDGIPVEMANEAYYFIAKNVGKYGIPVLRKNRGNSKKTCTCQGTNDDTAGRSYSLACAWSNIYNSCKFARGHKDIINLFRLYHNGCTMMKDKKMLEMIEATLKRIMNNMADDTGDMVKQFLPQAFKNMTSQGGETNLCRLGDPNKSATERPFAGATIVSDFCAHSHRDDKNMIGGITSVVTLLKPKNWNLGETKEPEDEQLHVLLNLAPAYSSEKVRGLGIALLHGSVLFEYAKEELHATTALKNPNRLRPTRIGVVFYQHRNLNHPDHGFLQWQIKEEDRKKTSKIDKICQWVHSDLSTKDASAKNGANNLSMKSTPGGKKSKKAKSNSRQNLSTGRSRKLRCGECEGCKSQNCGICIYCKDSKRFGGPGKMKQACKERICKNKSLSNNKSYSKNASPPGKKSSVKNTKLKIYSRETSKNSAPILPSKDDGESQSMNEFLETDPEINSSKENTDSILNPKIIDDDTHLKAIAELEGVIPEIREKIADTKDMQQETLKKIEDAFNGSASKDKNGSANKDKNGDSSTSEISVKKSAGNISHLVKKRSNDEKTAADNASPKKPRLETNGSSCNGASSSNGH